MRNGKNQRKLNKEKQGKPWKNSEGYSDPTAYLAMKLAERSGRKK